MQFGVITRDWLGAYGRLMEPLTAPAGSLVGKMPPAHPVPALRLQAYTGTYANEYFGNAVIARRNEALVLRLGPAGRESPLRHWDGNDFTFEPSGENASPGSISRVAFTMSSSGQAGSVIIEFYDQSGWAKFSRR